MFRSVRRRFAGDFGPTRVPEENRPPPQRGDGRLIRTEPDYLSVECASMPGAIASEVAAECVGTTSEPLLLVV